MFRLFPRPYNKRHFSHLHLKPQCSNLYREENNLRLHYFHLLWIHVEKKHTIWIEIKTNLKISITYKGQMLHKFSRLQIMWIFIHTMSVELNKMLIIFALEKTSCKSYFIFVTRIGLHLISIHHLCTILETLFHSGTIILNV